MNIIKTQLITLITMWILSFTLTAQTAVLAEFSNERPISVETSENLVTIQVDNGPVDLANPVIQVDLGTGIEYIPGSIAVTTGQTVQYVGSDLNQPQFEVVGGLVGGEFVRFTFKRKANCAARDQKNAGGSFEMTFTLTDGGNSIPLGGVLSTIPDDVIYGTVNIIDPTNTPSSVFEGETINRSVRVLNGNFGSLDTFYYRDAVGIANAVDFSNFVIDPSGINLAIPASQISINATNDTVIICFGINEIQQISGLADNATHNTNNDWFDQNESFILSYDIVPNLCGSQEGITSNLSSYWGGDGEICTLDEMGIALDFLTATAVSVNLKLPEIQVTNITGPTTLSFCMGGPGVPISSKIRIVNNGNQVAESFFWEYTLSSSSTSRSPTGYRSSTIDTTSLTYQVGSNGIPQSVSLENRSLNTNNYISCFDTIPNRKTAIVRQVGFYLPPIEPGDTIFLDADIYRCCLDNCTQYTVNEGLSYYYQYKEDCFDLAFSNTGLAVSRQYVNWRDLVEGPDQIVSGDTGYFNMTTLGSTAVRISRSVDDFYGTMDAHLQMVLDLPPGLDATTNTRNNFFIVNRDFTDTIYPTSIVRNYPTITIDYPVWNHSNGPVLSTDNFIVAKIHADCSIPGATTGGQTIGRRFNVIRDEATDCNTSCSTIPINCSSFQTFLYCPSACPDGVNLHAFNMERISVGGLDEDNNGTWDDDTSPAGSRAKLNRAIYGDTLGLELDMHVKTSATNPSFDYGHAILDWEYITSYATGTGDAPATLLVKKADGTIINCPDILYPQKVGSDLVYTFDCGAPYTLGDSLFLRPKIVITNRSRTRRESVEATTQGGNTGDYQQDTLGCIPLPQSYSLIQTYFTTYGPTTPLEFDGCAPKRFYHSYYYSVGPCCSNYNGGNLFPFEYRGLTFADSLYIDLPVGVNATDWRVGNNRTGGTRVTATDPVQSITPYAVVPKPGVPGFMRYYFDIGSLYDANGGTAFKISDEGWRIDLAFTLQPNCQLEPSISYPVGNNGSRTEWKPGIISNETDYSRYAGLAFDDPRDPGFARNVPVIIYNGPQLILSTNTPLVESDAKDVHWDAMFSSLFFGAENAWFYIEVPNSGYTDLRVVNKTTNDTITADGNGFFRLGNLAADVTNDWEILGHIETCSLDSIFLYADYDCTGYPTVFDNELCEAKRITLRSNAGVSRIAGTSIAPASTTYELCDPFDVSLDMLSALNGSVVDPAFDFILPTSAGVGGFVYVAGSGTIEYPVGTAPRPWDPDGEADFAAEFLTGNTTVSTSLAELDPDNFSDTTGFSKSSEFPNNQAVIRFKVEATCDFVAGSNFQFRVYGNDPCGTPALGDGELVQGFDVDINGVNVPYFTVIQPIISDPLPICDDSIRYFTIDVTKIGTGPTTTNDILEVLLPPFLSFEASAANPVNCSSTNCPSATYTVNTLSDNRTSIVWNWPAGVANGEQMIFEIPTKVADYKIACTFDSPIEVKTTAGSSAVCRGMPCSNFDVATGSKFADINILKGELDPSDFIVSSVCTDSGDELTINLALSNTGSRIDTTTILNFYADFDGNGAISPGDTIILIDSIQTPIGVGETVVFNKTYTGKDITTFCPILAVIQTASSCVCDDVTIASPQMIYENVEAELFVCSSDTTSLDACVSSGTDVSYMWAAIASADIDAVLSQDMPKSEFTYRNNTGADVTLTYELITTLGTDGCISRDTIDVTVYPEAMLPTDPNNPIMCLGGTTPALMVTAPTATTVEWYADSIGGTLLATGESYTPPGSFPVGDTTFYARTRTNDHNCPSFGSVPVTLTVAEQLTIDIEDISTCTREQTRSIPVPATLTNGTGSFTHQWTIVSSTSIGYTLSDQNTSTLLINVDENTTSGTIILEYQNTDNNGGCVTTEQVSVTLQRANCGEFPWKGNE